MHRSILFHLLFAASSAVLVRGMSGNGSAGMKEPPKGAAPLQQFKIGEIVEVHHNKGSVWNTVYKGIESAHKLTCVVESFGPGKKTSSRSLKNIKKKMCFQHPDSSLGIQLVSCTMSVTIENKDAEQPLPPNRHTGAIVSEALRGGRAFKEGIRKTQRVLKVGNKEVIHMLFDEIIKLIRNNPLDPLEFEVPLEVRFREPAVFRDGKEIEFGPAHGKIGAVVTAVDGDAKRRGVRVGQHVLALTWFYFNTCGPARESRTCGDSEYDSIVSKIKSRTFIPNIKAYYLKREEEQRIHRLEKNITVESCGGGRCGYYNLSTGAFRDEYPSNSKKYDYTDHFPASIIFGKRVTVKSYETEDELRKYLEAQKRIPNQLGITIKSEKGKSKKEVLWSLEWAWKVLKVDGLALSGSDRQHVPSLPCPENTMITFNFPGEEYYIKDAKTGKVYQQYLYTGEKSKTFELVKRGGVRSSCCGLRSKQIDDRDVYKFTIAPIPLAVD